jgi:glyoxylase-like metal-dependent hydrolase (beta-lactamase superfamily II)/rhodanese-related sulfurtransferase
MKIEQIYTGCLAQGAYFIHSNGEAVVIDPLREVSPYLQKAEELGVKIKYIFETHFHADFVSGHIDLAKKSGATIVFGPNEAPVGYETHTAHDGEIFQVGNISFELIHTPGHTMESSCYLLRDEKGEMHSIYTGDTLFIGDVGRPDLAQKVIPDLTQDKLARHLFHSLRNKLMPLPDHLIVYPAHGAGSACGKNMSKETFDSLGNQKRTNYALNPALSEEEFVKEILTGLTPPPAYFPENVLMNIKGYESFDSVLSHGLTALSVEEFIRQAENTDALILDTRKPADFVKGFIPNSINIGVDGQFAVWVGTLVLDIKQPILLITEQGREEGVVTRLSRVGYDNTIGFLKGGFAQWKESGNAVDTIQSITVEEAFDMAKTHELPIVDVRKNSEYNSEHVIDALNAPLDYVNDSMKLLDKDKTYLVHCAGGYRSVIFASILKARGFDKLIDVQGGFSAIKNSEKFDVSAYVCPSTML